MPRRTGQPTLMEERRKWKAKLLYGNHDPYDRQSSVKSWGKGYPDSKANANSARAMWGREVRWLRENFPEELNGLFLRITPDSTLLECGIKPPARKPLPCGRTEREKQFIRDAFSIIMNYCGFDMSLEECWRMVAPESSASPDSARKSAQRMATKFIRRYPGVAQTILEDYVRVSAEIKAKRVA